MGMYTQVRGFLCCDSIGQRPNIERQFKNLQATFKKRDDLDRLWVCEDTIFFRGSNDSGWLFIGSEHKNYDESMEEWLMFLINNIPCEGRIEFQYEEAEVGEEGQVWLVSKGNINKQTYTVHTYGYGFNYPTESERREMK